MQIKGLHSVNTQQMGRHRILFRIRQTAEQ